MLFTPTNTLTNPSDLAGLCRTVMAAKPSDPPPPSLPPPTPNPPPRGADRTRARARRSRWCAVLRLPVDATRRLRLRPKAPRGVCVVGLELHLIGDTAAVGRCGRECVLIRPHIKGDRRTVLK
jgi:hypothetical protein